MLHGSWDLGSLTRGWTLDPWQWKPLHRHRIPIHDIYFITGSLYFSIPFTHFVHPSRLPPFCGPPICSLYLWVCFVYSVCFLDSTYNWTHMVLVFLWFISLSEYPYFEIHPYFCKWQDLILLYDWVEFHCGASQVALVAKNLPANAGDVRDSGSIPGLGRSLEEGMATHSSILAWRTLWSLAGYSL